MFKKLLLLFVIQFAAITLYSQAPSLINYQAMARDASGAPVVNQNVAIKFEFKQNSTAVFTEVQNVSTNAFGLFSTQIGKATTGGVNAVNWQSAGLSLEVSLDITGGTSFVLLGSQLLVSVPYALYSQQAANVPATYTNNVLTIGAQSFTLASSTNASPQATITTSGIGTITSAGTNTFDINIPATNLTGAGSATVSGSFPNYTVTTPSAISNHPIDITSSGVGTISSAGTNTFDINVPATNLASGTNVTVNGAYPNYTISSAPTLTVNGNNLSISGGNTVPLPAGVTTSVTTTGAAQLTVLATDSYSIHVPQTNVALTNAAGTASVTNVGTNTVSINIPQTGIAVTTAAGTTSVTNVGTNSVSINIPQPTLSVAGNNLSISGGNTIPLPAGVTTSVTTTGAAQLTVLATDSYSIHVPQTNVALTNAAGTASVTNVGTNSVSINIPQPTLSVAGNNLSISGGNTIPLPAGVTTSVTTTGAAQLTVLATDSYSIHVPQTNVALTNAAGTASVTNVGTNSVSINIPQTGIAVTTAAGTTSVTNVGTNSVSINIPQPTLSVAGNNLSISGGNTIPLPAGVTTSVTTTGAAQLTVLATDSYSIHVPQTNVALTNAAGTASVTNVGTNSVSINIPQPTLSVAGNNLSISGGNTIPLPAGVTTSVTTTGAAQLTVLATDSYSIHVPQTNVALTNAGGTASVTNVGTNSVSINIPQTGIAVTTAAGTTSVTNVGTNSVSINIPQPTLSVAGNNLSISGGNTILLPSAPTPTITGSGLATATGNDVNVPVPAYNATSGDLSFGATNINVVPTLSLNGTVLSSGPSTNSVNIGNNSSWGLNGNSGTSPVTNFIGTTDLADFIIRTNNNPAVTINTQGFMGLGHTGPDAFLDIDAQSLYSGFRMRNGKDIIGGPLPMQLQIGTAGQNYGVDTYGRILRFEDTDVNQIYDFGFTPGGNLFLTHSSNYGNPHFLMTISGNIGLGVLTPSERLDLSGNLKFSGALMPNGAAGAAGEVLQSAGPGLAPVWANVSGSISGGTTDYVTKYSSATGITKSRIFDNGTSIGIGTNLPNGEFHVNSFGSSTLMRLTNTGATTGLVTYVDGLSASILNYENSPLYFGTGGMNHMVIDPAGNVGIGVATPLAKLDVLGSIKIKDGNEGHGKVLTSDVNGLASWQPAVDPGWSLIGNPGTNTLTNFIGTTDNEPLLFRIDNTHVGRIEKQNIYFGFQANPVHVPGLIQNTAFGGFALNKNSANGNTGIGYSSLSNNVGGSDNTAVGNNALSGNSTGTQNTGVGMLVLSNNTTGGYNTAIGTRALAGNTTGNANTAIGYEADVIDNNLYSATAIGTFAKVGVSYGVVLGDTSNAKVGIGTGYPSERLHVKGNVRFSGALMPNNAAGTAGQILQSNGAGAAPTWVNNSGAGWGLTGNSGTTPGTNFIGTTDNKALVFKTNNVTSGIIDPIQFNTFLGSLSGNAVSTGSYNTGMGWQALRFNTTGGSNTAYGSEAMVTNSTGSFNSAFGRNALYANSGSNNSAFGTNVLYVNTGTGNSAFGSNAMQNNTGGNLNSAFGNSALLGNISGVQNVAVGYNALNNNNTGSYNTAAGYSALSANTNGTNNVAMGYLAGQVTVGSGNVFIGANAGSTVTSVSNKLYIANSSTATLIHGDFATGNVGINNVAPTQALDVTGNVRLSGALMPNNAAGTAGQVLQSAGAGAPPTWATLSSTGWAPTGNAGTTAGTNFIGTTDAQDVVFKSNNAEVFRVQSAGVIRMLSGADRTITMQGQTSNIDANHLMIRGSDAGVGGQARYGGSLILQGGDGYNQSNPIHFGGNVIIRPGKNQYGAASYNSGSVIFQNVTSANAYVEAARFDGNGNLGIGTTTPSEKLDVVGSIVIPAASEYRYASAKTNYLTISPASFSSINGITVGGNGTGNARWLASGSAAIADALYATVQLPTGAVITAIDAYVLDNDVTNDVSVTLNAIQLSINNLNPLGTTNSTSGASFTPVVISNTTLLHTVDNANYSYYLTFNTRQNTPNLWIRGVRITYTVNKAN